VGFSKGRPHTLDVCNDDSLGEQIQRAYPEARVVKALNTMNCEVMVQPSLVPGRHNVFVCGEEAEAKHLVIELLRTFGWPTDSVIDLGGIAAARGTEMYLPLWLQLMGATGTPRINILVEKG
jgi:8-hydroxy-5-deazaflavin:NADPH oxidoreductase